jgi:hypothetical protein
MKVLDIPYTHHDMRYSLSLTGVTTLTQSRYKMRHSGAREIVQVPGKGFMLASQYKKTLHHEPPKKKRRKKPQKDTTTTEPQISKVSQYRIDKTEVTHRIRGYINQMKGEKLLYFWTISFPINTTDDTAYILLNKWLTRLRQERLLREYLWIAERQENNTIHFHMVINQRMDVKKANRFMRASIMHCINKDEIKWTREAAVKYNGVDIAKDRKTKRVTNFAKGNKQKSLSNYLTKYITKNDSTFTHLAWHSSRGYSNLITAVRITEKEFQSSNLPKLISTESPLIAEYFIHHRWQALPPKDLLMYLALINQDIQRQLTRSNKN